MPDAAGRLDTAVVSAPQFLRDGFVVLRQCVPAPELPALRAAVEGMAERHLARDADVLPPSYSSFRLNIHDQVPSQEADAVVRYCLGPNTLGVSDALLGRGDAVGQPVQHSTICIAMQVLCSGNADHGATDCHRDASSSGQAPLGGMQDDMQANGIAYCQWNVACPLPIVQARRINGGTSRCSSGSSLA